MDGGESAGGVGDGVATGSSGSTPAGATDDHTDDDSSGGDRPEGGAERTRAAPSDAERDVVGGVPHSGQRPALSFSANPHPRQTGKPLPPLDNGDDIRSRVRALRARRDGKHQARTIGRPNATARLRPRREARASPPRSDIGLTQP